MNKNHCGQKFALSLLLLKVWAEFRGNTRSDGHKRVRKFIWINGVFTEDRTARNLKCHFRLLVGGDRGAGARENRGREGYGRREREGREVGDLRGREAGEKCETLIFLIQQFVTKLLKSRTQNIFDLHLTSSQSLLRLLSKRANENLRLGWKTGLLPVKW